MQPHPTQAHPLQAHAAHVHPAQASRTGAGFRRGERADDNRSVLLSAAAIVADSRVHRPGWLEIASGTVIGYASAEPPRPVDFELGEVTVVPGFVDMHIHGGGGGSFSTAPDAGLDAEARRAVAFQLSHGTTTLLASLVTAAPADLLRSVTACAELVEDGLLAGIHLEGPWLSAEQFGAHELSLLRDPDPAELSRLLSAGRGTIRMVTYAPERSGALEAIRRTVAAGVVAAVGHTDATYDTTRAAITAGASVATHLFNAMRAVHHREPGPVVALAEDERVTLELILDGAHLHPAIYRAVMAAVAESRVALVTDAMAAAGMPDGRYQLGALAVDVQSGEARLLGSQTLAGSTATMDMMFRHAHRDGGGSPDAALLRAVSQTSANPARVFGWSGHDLSVGGRADLVVLDGHLQPAAVMLGGRWVSGPA